MRVPISTPEKSLGFLEEERRRKLAAVAHYQQLLWAQTVQPTLLGAQCYPQTALGGNTVLGYGYGKKTLLGQ